MLLNQLPHAMYMSVCDLHSFMYIFLTVDKTTFWHQLISLISWSPFHWRFFTYNSDPLNIIISCISIVGYFQLFLMPRQHRHVPWQVAKFVLITSLQFWAEQIFSCDQAALQMVFSVRLSVCLSVRLSVCPSVCHTFFTTFPSSYHHEIFRSYYHGQKWCPCKRSRSEVKGQGHRRQHPT